VVRPSRRVLKTVEFEESVSLDIHNDLDFEGESALFINMRALFNIRPVWLRNALLFELKKTVSNISPNQF
jgi:hypothetical protein